MNFSPNNDIYLDDFRCVICIKEAGDEANLGKMMEENFSNYSTSMKFEDSDMLWIGKELQASDSDLVSNYDGYINRIYGTKIFEHKEIQYTIMNQWKKYYPESFKFHPVSYSLMREFDLLQEDVANSGPSKSWIAKPSSGLNGDDIFLFDTIEELVSKGVHDDMVVQHYIHNPLILKGKKWDARIYLIIHGINPMRGYISFDTGFGRLWVDDYDPENITNPYSNITNSAVNNKHPKFVVEAIGEEDEDQVYGRYSLSRVWELIKEEYPDADIEGMKEEVKKISNSLLKSYRSSIEIETSEFMEIDGRGGQNEKFFHVLGLDIMFDADFKPWLLETNRLPGMHLEYDAPNREGILIERKSEIFFEARSTIINEATKILMGKEESTRFMKCYDSSEPDSEDASFLYERVYKIFKRLCDYKLKTTITIKNFINFITSASITDGPLDWDSVIHKLNLKKESEMTLPELFTGLEILSESVSMNFLSFLNRIEQL